MTQQHDTYFKEDCLNQETEKLISSGTVSTASGAAKIIDNSNVLSHSVFFYFDS